SITTNKKNHLLFVGPRGSGKTHFISMVVNRLKNKPALKEKMVIIWLGEDDVITSLLDLLLLMIENLVRTNPDRFNKDCLQQAKGQKPDTVAEIIMHSISEQMGDHTILLVKENMSDVFAGLKDTGQKKFRAFLQEQNNIAILGTSQQLFPGVASRDAAFFGFFDTYHLKVLSVDDAKQLISNIAALNKNQALVDFLETAQGCYRVRALHHLAGGNHRLYVELSAFLTMESLDDFVSALTKLADNLTPYFQERIRSLPAQQGRIVQKLCELQGATPVKTIAEETFIGERSVAKQLGDLAKKGYVTSHKRGKQSYYEMAEPLMRLTLEVKNNQGRPLNMVASLLRAWFSDTELQTDHEKESGLLSVYKKAALSIDKEMLVIINIILAEQIYAGIAANDYEKVIAASNEIINAPQTDGIPLLQRVNALNFRGAAYFLTGEMEKAFQDLIVVLGMKGLPAEQKAQALLFRGCIYVAKSETGLALQDWTDIIDMQGVSKELVTLVLFVLPIVYFNLLQIDKAQLALEEAFIKGEKGFNHLPSNTNNTLRSISQLGSSCWQKQITWILALYSKYGALNCLGAALILSISSFIEDEFLRSSFKKWQQLWQEHGEKYQAMQLSLQVLQAAVLAVEQKNDKPLMRVPKEVRELVLPLLTKALD
ncbi:MAG: hypothetical protein GQ529_01805, partial [Methyloprofundus sp.]|nr:hypothetical protein [Methyloprofundus sp.]